MTMQPESPDENRQPERYRVGQLQELTEQTVSAVESVIRNHGVFSLPTESFYALSASVFDSQALDRVLTIKNRPPGNPLLVLIGALTQLPTVVKSVPPAAQVLMDTCWPGPLTIIFPAVDTLPPTLTGGTDSIGVRLLPSGPVARLLSRIGPVTGTSANRSGSPPPRTPQDVMDSLDGEFDLILDQGKTAGGPPSTLVDARSPIRLLREGAMPFEQIRWILSRAGCSIPP